MNKLLPIETCNDCKHAGHYVAIGSKRFRECFLAKRKLELRDYKNIPEECPLEDKT